MTAEQRMVLKVAIDKAVRDRLARENADRGQVRGPYTPKAKPRKKPVYSATERQARSGRATGACAG
jgi:hypothetical protein